MRNNYCLFFLKLITLLLLGFAASCSFDYKEAMVDEEISGGTPNAIIINLEETVIERGIIAYSLKADKAETYDKKNLTVFTNIQFTEYDKSGEVATEGGVGHASYYSDTEDMEFDKSFKVESLQQGYYIKGDSLSWDGKQKILTADPEKEVTIGKEDGSYITGRGFNSNASNNSFTFENGIAGYYVSDDEDEEDTAAEAGADEDENARAEDADTARE